MPTPTEEEVEDVLLSCRYGELEEVKGFVEQYGWDALASARDDRGNTALHMCCGNGHADLLNFILPYSPASLLSETNSAKSPPIHWAVLNNHVPIVKTLAEYPEHKGGGLQLFKQKNAAMRDAFAEAVFAGEGKEEVAGWIEGFLWRFERGEELDERDDKNEKVKGESTGDGDMVEDEAKEVDSLAEKTDGVQLDET